MEVIHGHITQFIWVFHAARSVHAYINYTCHVQIQGWLFKRGVRGVTARVWRRRFFRCEGSKIYYYKTSSASKAQGLVITHYGLNVHIPMQGWLTYCSRTRLLETRIIGKLITQPYNCSYHSVGLIPPTLDASHQPTIGLLIWIWCWEYGRYALTNRTRTAPRSSSAVREEPSSCRQSTHPQWTSETSLNWHLASRVPRPHLQMCRAWEQSG